MADFSSVVKGAVAKSIEAIGNAANTLANTTKNKVDEMNLNEKRREKLAEFTTCAYEGWKKGLPLPKELDVLLSEVAEIDQQLEQLRGDRAGVKAEEPAAPTIQVEPERPAEVSDDTVPVVPMPEITAEEARGAAMEIAADAVTIETAEEENAGE